MADNRLRSSTFKPRRVGRCRGGVVLQVVRLPGDPGVQLIGGPP